MSARGVERLHADVLVVGAGIAGLSAALSAAPRRVTLLCAEPPAGASSSALAQGGIAVAVGAGDSVADHVADTLEAAAFAASPVAARGIIAEAPAALEFLDRCGVVFDRAGQGLSLHREAGHRRARVVHAGGDRTGAAIVAALWARAREAAHIDIVSDWRAVSLVVTPTYGAAGIDALDRHGNAVQVLARETVLATGGLGRLYRYTTNGRHATGDGLAMALDAGARLAGIEFVQFHPTALKVADDPLPLLTEALRGAGARLVTGGGDLLMAGGDPRGDLAPRDIVARIVFERSQAGEAVYLDARAVFQSERGHAFPGAYATARAHGFDPVRQPLPVTAAAHYHMGGIVVDARAQSNIRGLWAVGEVASTGLHGANRLASNSLLEAVVCGLRAGGALGAGCVRAAPPPVAPCRAVAWVDAQDPRWPRLRERLWDAMGPVRCAARLREALDATLVDGAALADGDLILRRRYALAATMMRAALTRAESRGAHWRSDFPRRDVSRDGPYPTEAAEGGGALT